MLRASRPPTACPPVGAQLPRRQLGKERDCLALIELCVFLFTCLNTGQNVYNCELDT